MKISRVKRSKAEAKASYDKMSKWYDILACTERKFAYAGLQKLNAKKEETVLEIGFGTGHCILDLAQSVGNKGKIHGIDISEEMYNITRARINAAGLSERVELKCGDAAKLPHEANFFDAAFSSFTLELFDTPEIPVVLHECHRVLRNDGRICVVALSKKRKTSIRLYEWFHEKFPKYVDCRPIFVQKMLEEAGFQILNVTEKSMWSLPVDIVVAKKV